MPTESTLARKTKQELIQDYLKLTEAMDVAKATELGATSQGSIDFVAGVKSKHTDALFTSVAEARRAIDEKLSDVSRAAREELDRVIEQLAMRRVEFEELQKAIDVSRQTLAAGYNLQLAAGALEALVQEYQKKEHELEAAYRLKAAEFERQAEDRKRTLDREQEEAAYRAVKTNAQREEEQKDVVAKREKELVDKEHAFAARLQEVEDLRKSLEASNRLAETRLAERENKAKTLSETEQKCEAMKREWEAERALTRLQIEQLEKDVKREQAENVLARKEAEAANKKAQDLAVRIIENSGRSATDQNKTAPVPTPGN